MRKLIPIFLFLIYAISTSFKTKENIYFAAPLEEKQKFNMNFMEVSISQKYFKNFKNASYGPIWYNIADAGANPHMSDIASVVNPIILYVHQNGGGTVDFPRMFNLNWKSSKLTCFSNVHLTGDDWGDTLQAIADTLLSYDNPDFSNAEGAGIDNLLLYGNGVGKVGIYGQLLFHFDFFHVKISTFKNFGLYGKGMLIGDFDHLNTENDSIGVMLDSANVIAAGGIVAPNIINFTGGEMRNNVAWGVKVNNSQGNINFTGLTWEGNGTIHNLNTGASWWGNGGQTIGETFNTNWFEANKGIMIFLGSTNSTIVHYIFNTQIFANPNASVGVDFNAPTNRTFVTIQASTILNDSIDLKLDNVSITGFFTQLEVISIGSNLGTFSSPSIRYLFIKDLAADQIVNLTSNTGTPTVVAHAGAGLASGGSCSLLYGSNIGAQVTCTTGSSTTANDTIFVWLQANTSGLAGSHPVVEGVNQAASALTGLKHPWYTTTVNQIVFRSDSTALSPSTTYIWNIVFPVHN